MSPVLPTTGTTVAAPVTMAVLAVVLGLLVVLVSRPVDARRR